MPEEDRLYNVIKAAFIFLAMHVETHSVGTLNEAVKLLMDIVVEREEEIDPDKLVDWLEVYLKNKQVRN